MGECCRCGACCKVVAISARGMTQDLLLYSLVRGLEYDVKQKMFLIPFECPHLIKPNEDDIVNGLTQCTCRIYKSRPKTCSNFKGKRMAKGQDYYIPHTCTMGNTDGRQPESRNLPSGKKKE